MLAAVDGSDAGPKLAVQIWVSGSPKVGFRAGELFHLVAGELHKRDVMVAPAGEEHVITCCITPNGVLIGRNRAEDRLADPQVRHVRTTAGEFLRSTDVVFDLAVNDMRMDPVMTCKVMLDVAELLHPGALGIATLKTGSRQPVNTVRRCLVLLRRRYEILYARQLHHNRREATVVMRLGRLR